MTTNGSHAAEKQTTQPPADGTIGGAADIDVLVVTHPYVRRGARLPVARGVLGARRRAAGWLLANRELLLKPSAANEGSPVRAMKSGTVIHAGEMSGYGLVVMLQHGRNLRTVYGHLSRIAVRSGDEVEGGDLIGNVGRTGNATGSHLHFEVWRWGRPDDPVPLLGGPPQHTPGL